MLLASARRSHSVVQKLKINTKPIMTSLVGNKHLHAFSGPTKLEIKIYYFINIKDDGQIMPKTCTVTTSRLPTQGNMQCMVSLTNARKYAVYGLRFSMRLICFRAAYFRAASCSFRRHGLIC